MSIEPLFTAGSEGLIPKADAARQAVDSLRGYAYQVTAAALAWLDVGDHARIFLEVAEDYATVADGVLKAVQVKDTQASTRVTLNTDGVRDAIANFIVLVEANPRTDVTLEYLTTSDIGSEKPSIGCPSGESGLLYWRVAAKSGDVSSLRNLLEGEKFPDSVRTFVKSRDDKQLRNELLRKIHWNCGQPDLASLRREFQERLVVIGRDRFQVPATEISKVADILLYCVLEKSIGKIPTERVLTRADLISTIDYTTRISIPRGMLERFAVTSIGLSGQSPLSIPGVSPVPLGSPAWLTSDDTLPKVLRLLPRPKVEMEIEDKVRKFGACFIIGTSGIGKTNLARSVAGNLGGRFAIVDFRNIGIDEAIVRLSVLLSRLGDLQAQTILLEDLNCFNNPQIDLAIVQVMSAMERRDILAIITCYAPPSAKTLTNIGLKQGCTQLCPYLNEDEATQLTKLHDGDAVTWGGLAYVSGAFGHPKVRLLDQNGNQTRQLLIPFRRTRIPNPQSLPDLTDSRGWLIRKLGKPSNPDYWRELAIRAQIVLNSAWIELEITNTSNIYLTECTVQITVTTMQGQPAPAHNCMPKEPLPHGDQKEWRRDYAEFLASQKSPAGDRQTRELSTRRSLRPGDRSRFGHGLLLYFGEHEHLNIQYKVLAKELSQPAEGMLIVTVDGAFENWSFEQLKAYASTDALERVPCSVKKLALTNND